MTRARIFSQSGIGGSGANANISLSLAALAPFLTTANVRETANLYFSNSRSFANLTLASINDLYDVVTRDGSGVSTANVGSGLIWTGNVWAPGIVSANLSNFTTDDLPQGANNLYFTNALARRAFTAGNPYIEIDWNLGTISANLVAVSAGANTTDSIPEGVNNLYYRDSRVFANLKLASVFDLNDVLNAGDIYPSGHPKQTNTIPALNTGDSLVWYAASGKWVPESASLGTADYANVAEFANTVLQIGNFTTDDLAEGANNFYLTESRFANLLATANIIFVPSASISAFANLAAFANVAGLTNFANVAGLTNFANVAGVANNANTAIFAETANVANIALRAVFAEVANTVIFANAATFAAQVLNLDNHTTSNLNEGSNLYYTDARVASNVSNLSINIFADVSTAVANVGEILTWTGSQWVANALPTTSEVSERANIANLVLTLSNFTTSNLAEGVNLYFTEERLSNGLANAISGKDITVNNLIAQGNLIVDGDFVILNVSNVTTESRRLTLAFNSGGSSQAEGSGIYIDGANALLAYSDADNGFGLNKNLTVHGNIYPALNGRYNLGSSTRQWRGLFIGAQTIYLGNTQISEGTNGGISIKDQFGNPATIEIANVTSTATVTVESGGYFGGNTAQFGTNDYGNVYFGIQKNNDLAKFAGMRVTERPDEVTGQTRGDVILYTQYEGYGSSTPTLELLAKGNVIFNTNVVYINGHAVLDTDGNFIGNTFLGTKDIAIEHGGTSANTRPQALRNLFANVVNRGFVVKAANGEITTISLVQGTGVYIANADVAGPVTISIGQDVRPSDSVEFKNVSIANNLVVYGDITTFGANNLSVSDNMIYLNNTANASPNPDLGISWGYERVFDANVEANGYVHGGIYRDHFDSTIKFFENYRPEPDASQFINSADSSYQYANIAVALMYGDVIGTVSSLINHTTSDLAEGTSLYFTPQRALDAVNPRLTTANVVELNNLYFTNARAYAAVANTDIAFNNVTIYGDLLLLGAADIEGNPQLTDIAGVNRIGAQAIYSDEISSNIWTGLYTANVIETSDNLYFTNTRAYAAVANTDIAFGNVTIYGDLLLLGAADIEGNPQLTDIAGVNRIGAQAIYTDEISSNIWNGIYTANVIETSDNLYFTNSRAYAAVANTDIAFGNVTIYGDLLLLGAADIEGNPQLTDIAGVNRVGAQAIYTDEISSNIWNGLYTANVIELDNLYFTNTRAYAAVANTDIAFGNVTIYGDLLLLGAADIEGNPQLTDIAGVNRIGAQAIYADEISSNIWTGLYTANVIELDNLYFTNSRAYAAVANTDIAFGNVTIRGDLILLGGADIEGVFQLSDISGVDRVGAQAVYTGEISSNIWTGLYTANVIELDNLYFTNSRVLAALATSNVLVNSLTISGDLIVQGNSVVLSTATLTVEDKNIVLANGAINAAAADGAGITIDGAQANITYVASGDKITVNKNLEISGNLTIGSGTGSNVSGINQLFTQLITTDIIVANSWSKLYTANVIETAGNLYYTDARVNAAVRPMLTTANVIETAGNLYFSNARVVSALIAGQNITIEANGRISGTSYSDANVVNVLQNTTTKLISNVRNSIKEVLIFNLETYRSVKFVYTVNTTAYTLGEPQYASGEMLVMHSGSNTYATQYALLSSTTEDDLVGFSTDINNGNVRILASTTYASTVANIRLSGITYTSV